MIIQQIKSRARISEHGEVFTAQREVNAMLDLVREESTKIESTFLEPACGNGNFLTDILSRKLKSVKRLYRDSTYDYELHAIQAVSSIYGVDIQEDNVVESRIRLYDNFFFEYVRLFNLQPSIACQKAMTYVLQRNIQYGNTLTYTAGDGTPLLISEWVLDGEGCFTRKDYSYRAMVQTGSNVNAVKVYPRTNFAWLDSTQA